MSHRNSLTSLKVLLANFHATNTIIISFLPLYLAYKGLNGTEIGWVLAIGPFASIISQPFWGYLSDKYKTIKKLLIVSILGMLIGSIIFFHVNHLIAILVFGAIFYFFSSPVGALSDSLAQRRAHELRISFGPIRMWGSIGFGFSTLVIGEILTKTSVEYMVWPYVILGSILLVVAFTISDVKVDSTPIQLRDINKLVQNKAFVLFLIIMMFITITHRANDSFIGLYITGFGGTERLVGIAWFIGVISEAAVFALAGFWFRRYNPLIFIIIASSIFAIRWFLYGITSDPITIIVLQVLHGATFAVFYFSAFDYVSKIIPQNLQSTGHLVYYSMFFGVSGIIGSMGGGIIFEVYDGATLYLTMGVLAIIGTICFIVYLYFLKQKKGKLSLI